MGRVRLRRPDTGEEKNAGSITRSCVITHEESLFDSSSPTLPSDHLINCASSWSVFLLRECGLACQAKRSGWVIPAIDKTGGLRFLGFSYLERMVGFGHWANALHLAKMASIRGSIEIGEECRFQS